MRWPYSLRNGNGELHLVAHARSYFSHGLTWSFTMEALHRISVSPHSRFSAWGQAGRHALNGQRKDSDVIGRGRGPSGQSAFPGALGFAVSYKISRYERQTPGMLSYVFNMRRVFYLAKNSAEHDTTDFA